MTKRMRVTIAAVAAIAVASVPIPTQAGRARIKATSDNTWSPSFKHVVPGTKVIWKNPDSDAHTVTAYGGNWSKNSPLPVGGKTSKKFRKEGTFKFRCTNHSTLVNGTCDGMCGTVHVEK